MNGLTILICTHNRSQLLLRTLEHLNKANLPAAWQTDVLVVANACSDNTLECLARFRKDSVNGLSLNWIEESIPGKSNALNTAMPRIQSELVAFVDDDHRVDVDYLANICRAAEQYPQVDLFCGRILPDWDGSEPDWTHDTGPYRIYPLPVPRYEQGDQPRTQEQITAIPGGGNLFLRTQWLGKVGKFSTEYGPTGHDLGGAEDLEWVKRALHLGARLQYVPDVMQFHYVDCERLTLSYLLKKAYMRSDSMVRLANDKRYSGVPVFMYRKLAGYLFSVLTSLSWKRRRFYLVRLAAALGEYRGYAHRNKDGLKAESPARPGED